jgi:hypothetical protein
MQLWQAIEWDSSMKMDANLYLYIILANMPVRCNGIVIHYITGGTNMVVRQSCTRNTTATTRWLEPAATAPRAHCVIDHGKAA